MTGKTTYTVKGGDIKLLNKKKLTYDVTAQNTHPELEFLRKSGITFTKAISVFISPVSSILDVYFSIPKKRPKLIWRK